MTNEYNIHGRITALAIASVPDSGDLQLFQVTNRFIYPNLDAYLKAVGLSSIYILAYHIEDWRHAGMLLLDDEWRVIPRQAAQDRVAFLRGHEERKHPERVPAWRRIPEFKFRQGAVPGTGKKGVLHRCDRGPSKRMSERRAVTTNVEPMEPKSRRSSKRLWDDHWDFDYDPSRHTQRNWKKFRKTRWKPQASSSCQ